MATLHDKEFLSAQIGFTKPDYTLFVPRVREWESDGVCLFVDEYKKYGGLLAFWTQSTVENAGNNHLVMAGSRDGGKTWEQPRYIVGARRDAPDFGIHEAQASWGFPVESKSGRIYLFYFREEPGVVDNARQLTAALAVIYSDDCGEHWSNPFDLENRKTPYDFDARYQDNWVLQGALRGPDGKHYVGYTKQVSKKIDERLRGGSRVYFMRLENIDDDPEPADLKLTFLPEDENGLSVSRDGKTHHLQEPSFLFLPDGRLFCVMRTDLGNPYFAVSGDLGKSWSTPAPLCFADGTPLVHPQSPCPLFDMGDGRYLLLYHGAFHEKSPYFPRHSLHRVFGRFDPRAVQPIVFEKSDDAPFMELPDTADGMGYGKELAIYGSMTHQNGRHTLWYPDRKFFLLGKDVK